MPAGLLAGTSTTTLLVANVTGRVQRPAANSAWASFGLAAANTSAGAPFSIWRCSTFEPAKLYVAEPSISGNAARSEAAA